VLDPLYNLVARGVIEFHNLLAAIFGKHGFFSYAFAIAIIVVIVRILIFPLFVRSVKAQRTMQMLQPRIKELREKYKNDKQRMNQEVMKLQKEHGNPLLGCLPLLLQIPLFISLYHVFNAIARAPSQILTGPNKGMLQFKATSGLTGGVYDKANNLLGYIDVHNVFHVSSSRSEVAGLATAKFAGITLGSALTSSKHTLELLGANGTAVKIVASVMIVVMAITVYITQRQIMTRGGPVDPSQQKIQRVMLYGSPLLLAVFGLRFPIAVLIYWLTTNTWSMCQQVFILRKMPPVLPSTGAATATSGRASAPAVKGKSSLKKGAQPAIPAPPPRLTQKRQPAAIESASDAVAEQSDADKSTAATDATSDEAGSETPPVTSNGSSGSAGSNGSAGTTGSTNSAKGGGANGRTVSSGSGQGSRPRRNNRPAAKPKGKGPSKGGRR
jgi:YidC/Oxa1 family membrane protein insertase